MTENSEEPYFWMSVSDLMASLVFIFILLACFMSMKFQNERERFEASQKELRSPHVVRQQLLEGLKEKLARDGVSAEIDTRQGLLRFSENSLPFDTAKAYPPQAGRKTIGALAKALMEILPCYSAPKDISLFDEERPPFCLKAPALTPSSCSKNHDNPFDSWISSVVIEGHTDAQPLLKTAGYHDNLALSAARASTLFRMMKLCDPRLDLLKNKKGESLFSVSGYAHMRPLKPNQPYDSANRRIDVRFIMEIPGNALTISSQR